MEFEGGALWLALAALVTYLALLLLVMQRGGLKAGLYFPFLPTAARPSWKVRLWQLAPWLRWLALLLLLVAFARPRLGLEVVQTARSGIAIQMLLDRSSSMTQGMLIQGREASRLAIVKEVFELFVKGDGKDLPGRPHDLIGLTSFAGFVEENAPLTLDHASLVQFARMIRPAERVEDGTAIGDALYYSTLRMIAAEELYKKAREQEGQAGYQIKSKVIILLTDGQARGGMDPLEAARFAAQNHIRVHVIAIVPEQAGGRGPGLLGQFFSLMPEQLDTSLIEQVAKTTGGLFGRANSGEALLEIYKAINKLEKSSISENFTLYQERFVPLVALALVLLVAEVIITRLWPARLP